MDLRSFSHKGLKRLYEDDASDKLGPAIAERLRIMLAFLQDMTSFDELKDPPKWKAHRLTGDRRGTWNLFVTKNWRLTFRQDGKDGVRELNLEDYH